MSEDMVRPYKGDPFVGHLETPVSAGVGMVLVNNLPAYRANLSPARRGLEVGMAHGYLLLGPFYKLGPLRDSDLALAAGLLAAIGLVVILTVCLSLYGSVTFQKTAGSGNDLQSAQGWSDFSSSFLLGGCGGAGFAAGLLFSLEMLQGIAGNLFN